MSKSDDALFAGFCAEDAQEERLASKGLTRMRCRECIWLDWNFITQDIVPQPEGKHRCGQHGQATVDPDGYQRNLDNRGSCNFVPKAHQLTLF